MKKIPRRKSIKTKILGIVFLSLSLITAILIYLTFQISKGRIVSMMGDSIKGVATTTANFIKGEDIVLIQLNIDGIKERYLSTSTPSPPPFYEKAVDSQKFQSDTLSLALTSYVKYTDLLSGVQRTNKIESPINLFVKDGNHLKILLSSDKRFLIGSRYQMRPEAKKALFTNLPQASSLYKDKDGIWISAFAPIPANAPANLQAIIEIDNRVDLYIHKLRREFVAIVLVCLIGFLGTGVLSYELVNNLLLNIKKLNEVASDLERENYNVRIDIKSEDEIGHLAQTFEKLRTSIRKKIDELKVMLFKEKKAHLESIMALTNAIELRDPYTRQHLYRVDKYALLIAKAMHLAKSEVQKLRYTCYLHDIGKIYIEDYLFKKLQLSQTDMTEIKKHSEKGAMIIEGIPFLRDVKSLILSHQERYDGKGYPRGLKGEDIPLLARVVAVADAFDAMTTDRPYRSKIGFQKAMDVIEKNAGTQFDPNVCAAFLKYRNTIERIAKKHLLNL